MLKINKTKVLKQKGVMVHFVPIFKTFNQNYSHKR